MRNERGASMLLGVVLITLSLAACAGPGGYGKLRLQPEGKDKVTPAKLLKEWNDYDVYYAGISTSRPSAVLFDPKGDGNTIQCHKWWIRIEDRETLKEVMSWLTFDMHFEPVVWRILGPEDEFFGYMYTWWNHVLIRVVDGHTIWVNDMSMPPDYPAGAAWVDAPSN
jgi:hypothetical protein